MEESKQLSTYRYPTTEVINSRYSLSSRPPVSFGKTDTAIVIGLDDKSNLKFVSKNALICTKIE